MLRIYFGLYFALAQVCVRLFAWLLRRCLFPSCPVFCAVYFIFPAVVWLLPSVFVLVFVCFLSRLFDDKLLDNLHIFLFDSCLSSFHRALIVVCLVSCAGLCSLVARDLCIGICSVKIDA